MTPLEATVQLMQNWAVTGLLKGRTPDELRGDAIALYTGLRGVEAPAKRARRKVEEPKPVHVDMGEPW